jgi:hypothetical protein
MEKEEEEGMEEEGMEERRRGGEEEEERGGADEPRVGQRISCMPRDVVQASQGFLRLRRLAPSPRLTEPNQATKQPSISTESGDDSCLDACRARRTPPQMTQRWTSITMHLVEPPSMTSQHRLVSARSCYGASREDSDMLRSPLVGGLDSDRAEQPQKLSQDADLSPCDSTSVCPYLSNRRRCSLRNALAQFKAHDFSALLS